MERDKIWEGNLGASGYFVSLCVFYVHGWLLCDCISFLVLLQRSTTNGCLKNRNRLSHSCSCKSKIEMVPSGAVGDNQFQASLLAAGVLLAVFGVSVLVNASP